MIPPDHTTMTTTTMSARLLRREALRRAAAGLQDYLSPIERIERQIVAEVTADALERKQLLDAPSSIKR